MYEVEVALRAIIADEYGKRRDLSEATLFANVPPVNDEVFEKREYITLSTL